MKLDVRQIQRSIPFICETKLPPYDKTGRVSFPNPLTANGAVYRRGGVLILEADWQVWAEMRCDRCDAPFSRKLTGTVSQVLSEKGDKFEAANIFGGFCDIDEILTPAVFLSVENKNLCSEDCPGNPNWIVEVFP
ncbi:MAG: DUF177 domain-containing protein [Oscillospiraceae bacterium]|nr:DUF177 domain-containing protein [Oscillospiraceae bacterium]